MMQVKALFFLAGKCWGFFGIVSSFRYMCNKQLLINNQRSDHDSIIDNKKSGTEIFYSVAWLFFHRQGCIIILVEFSE